MYGEELSAKGQLRLGSSKKLRPIIRSSHGSVSSEDGNRSIFKEFVSTHVSSQRNGTSTEKPLLESPLSKPPVPKDRRPKLSRQKGRTNSAFEDEPSIVRPQSQDLGHATASSVLQIPEAENSLPGSEYSRVCSDESIQEMKELKTPKKPRRRRNKLNDNENTIEEDKPSTTNGPQNDALDNNEVVNEEILGIVIHGADRLDCSIPISLTHPVVKVHILDAATGQYSRKTERSRAVTSYYEHQKVEHILPLMTQPFLINQKNPCPLWEELLIFNEAFASFIQVEPATLVVFEIMDFLSPSSSDFHIKSEEKGWYPLAWAFLKPRGGNGHINAGHRACLQLYHAPPPSTFFFSRKRKAPHVYDWWQGNRQKHPGCLYVTFKAIRPPQNIQPALRSMIPMQQEFSFSQNENLDERIGVSSRKPSLKVPNMVPQKAGLGVLSPWNRLPGQACRVPLQQVSFLSNADKGVFRVRFSPDGCFLACAACGSTGSCIEIYEIPGGASVAELKGHTGLIYDLDWYANGEEVLSASADGTVRLWNPTRSMFSICVVPHPSYVYSAKFHPVTEKRLIVTGCYDRLIRLWQLPVSGTKKSRLQLLQELEGHGSSVNVLLWSQEGRLKLYSGDGSGTIKLWLQVDNSPGVGRYFECRDTIKEKSIQGHAISSLNVLPNSKKIMVETQDGCHHSIHLSKHLVSRVYGNRNNNNGHFFGRGSLSPCGNLLFALGDRSMELTSKVVVWNTLNGTQVHKYDFPSEDSRVSCVDYHPFDHLVAFSLYGRGGHVLMYGLIPRGPLKSLPPIVSSATESPSRDSVKEVTETHSASKGNELQLHKVLSKLDSVLNLSSRT